MLEIVLLQNLGAFAGDNSDCRTMAPADQEDGAQRRRKRKAEGGDEDCGEKHPEDPARAGSCRVSSVGSGISKGGSIRAASERVRAVVGQV